MARFCLYSVLLPVMLLGAWVSGPVFGDGDADGDGIPDSTDICPLLPNPEQRDLVKLNGPLVAGGEVREFALSPDGSWVVYVADQDTDEMFELFRVPVEGGAPLKLNAPLIAEGDVSTFRISPDGSRVVYRADQQTNGRFSVYSVPMDGGPPVLLSGSQWTYGHVLVSPDNSWVAYLAPDALFANLVYFTVSILGGTVYEHNTEQPTGEGNVYGGQFSPDSQWLLFLDASGSPSAGAKLYRTPPGQSGLTGLSFDIVGPSYAISPDSARVVYGWGDENAGLTELRSRPIGSTGIVILNDPADPWPYVTAFDITPVEIDGIYRVAFGDAYGGLVSIAIDGTDRIILDSSFNPRKIAVSPDGSRVVYGTSQVFSVDILGLTDPVELSGSMTSGGVVSGFAISPDSQRVVYIADQDTDGMSELFATSISVADEVKLNPALIPDGDVDVDYLISPDGESVVFRADHVVDEVFELFAASIQGGEPLRLNDSLPPGGLIQNFGVSADGARVTYLGDQDTGGVDELYSVLLYTDRDADGVYGSCDCAPGDDQNWTLPGEVSDLLLQHTGGESGTTTLSWVDVDYSGGAAVAYDTLRTDLSDGFRSGSGGTIFCLETDDGGDTVAVDSTPPGDAFYYLIRAGNACGEGSAGERRDAGVNATCP